MVAEYGSLKGSISELLITESQFKDHLLSPHSYDLAFKTSVTMAMMCIRSSSFIGLPMTWIPLGAPSIAFASSEELVRGGYFSFTLIMPLTRRLIGNTCSHKALIKFFICIEIWNWSRRILVLSAQVVRLRTLPHSHLASLQVLCISARHMSRGAERLIDTEAWWNHQADSEQ